MTESTTLEGQQDTVAVTTKEETTNGKSKRVSQAASVFWVPFEAIVKDESPRHEPSNLYDEGWVLLGKHPTWEPPEVEEGEEPETRTPLMEMALNKDIEVVREFVDLIETWESVDRKEHPGAPQSIVELAYDLELYGQLMPILVHKVGKEHWSNVDGGRRITALLYNYAWNQVAKADGEDVKIPKPVVMAMDAKTTKAQDVQRVALIINLSRKQFTPIQEARAYWELTQTENPDTGRHYTMKEAAELLGVEYGTFRNRHALMKPYAPAEKDGRGNVIKPAKGLTDGDREKLSTGELTLTAAIRKALGGQHYSKTGAPKGFRQKALPLKEMQKLFDDTAETNSERRQAIAECMGLGFKQAVKQSEERIRLAEGR